MVVDIMKAYLEGESKWRAIDPAWAKLLPPLPPSTQEFGRAPRLLGRKEPAVIIDYARIEPAGRDVALPAFAAGRLGPHTDTWAMMREIDGSKS